MTNNRLPFGIGDFVVSLKGDAPGHPFRGNQFEGGTGGNESAPKGQALPKPKIIAGHEVSDSFVNKKGSALYTLQKPTDDNDRGWAVVKTMRRDKDNSPIHFYETTGKRDEVTKAFNDIKRYEG